MSKSPPNSERWSSFDPDSLSNTKLSRSALGVCTSVVHLFMGVSKENAKPSAITSFRTFSSGSTNLKRALLYCLSALFTLLLIIDIIHLASGGEYQETPYGKENPMISLLGFCSSQITLSMSFIGSVFIIRQSENVTKCARMLDQLLVTFDAHCKKAAIVSQKTYLVKYFFVFVLLALVRFGCAVGEEEVSGAFYNETVYVWLTFPIGAVKLYSEACILMAMFMYIPVTALFTYFCSMLVCCLQAFRAENEALLHAVDPTFSTGVGSNNKAHEKDSPGISTEEFVARLKILRIHHENINDAYDQLQATFGMKLLVDILTNVFALLSVIAWFSMWSVNRDLANAGSGAWNGLSVVIYVISLWLVTNRPLLLKNKHGKMVDEIEKILYRRQMVKNMKPSREEISIIFALRQRLKTKILSFSAGGVLDIHGMAVSLVAGIAGFIAFIMERIEDFKAHLDSNTRALAVVPITNVTCTG